MKNVTKSVTEINNRIDDNSVKVVTAAEMTQIVAELGPDEAAEEVDVVTTGTFGAMCSSGVWLNFGHSEPPLKMTKVWLNDVEAYTGVAAVDAYIGATQPSVSRGIEYGGAHVIEDLLRKKHIYLKAESYGTDCYPRKELLTEVSLDELNQATMCNPRNGYQRYVVATNSTNKDLYTYLGKLLANFDNATFSGAGELSPIMNDPNYRTIGIGTKIVLGGAQGYIIGSGTQHSPQTGFGTLMVKGNLKDMDPYFVKASTFEKYGCSLYVGIGVPIPILNTEMAKSTGISDRDIITNVLDYGIPSRKRPILRKVSYEELKSGKIEINGQEVRTSPISSFSTARKIAEILKDQIKLGNFYLTQPVELLPTNEGFNPLVCKKLVQYSFSSRIKSTFPGKSDIYINEEQCVNCGLCLSYCPSGVYSRDDDWNIFMDLSKCVKCGRCQDICPFKAIKLRDHGREAYEKASS